jgi:hypothetical protein
VLLALRSAEHGTLEVGYLFSPRHGGRGYVTETVRALLDLAFGFGFRTRITESRLRRLLRTDDLAEVSDSTGRALLRRLPRVRPAGHRDGPATSLARTVATLGAWWRWS